MQENVSSCHSNDCYYRSDTCIYICICIYAHVYMHMYIYIYAHVYRHMHICTCIYAHVSMHMHISHVCIYVHVYMHMHIIIYTITHANIHMHICNLYTNYSFPAYTFCNPLYNNFYFVFCKVKSLKRGTVLKYHNIEV